MQIRPLLVSASATVLNSTMSGFELNVFYLNETWELHSGACERIVFWDVMQYRSSRRFGGKNCLCLQRRKVNAEWKCRSDRRREGQIKISAYGKLVASLIHRLIYYSLFGPVNAICALTHVKYLKPVSAFRPSTSVVNAALICLLFSLHRYAHITLHRI